jgi:hypothetical protein
MLDLAVRQLLGTMKAIILDRKVYNTAFSSEQHVPSLSINLLLLPP